MKKPKSDIEYPSMKVQKIESENCIIEDEEIDFLEYDQKVNFDKLDLSNYKSNTRDTKKD